MYGEVVDGIDGHLFEAELQALKERRNVRLDVDLTADDLRGLITTFQEIYEREVRAPFPQEADEQLRRATRAVFDSWESPRAKVYRRTYDIPDDLGTAVNVVQMVFGNKGDTSGTGVCFTRNPSTGERVLFGEFLVNAQGEDVVAGIRTPEPIERMRETLPEAYERLVATLERLEDHYREMQDIEFTVEDGALFLLQTRTGKRTAQAALRVAVEMQGEGLISREEAVARIDPGQLDQLLHPMIDPTAEVDVVATGLNASPGAASGAIVLDADLAEEKGKRGRGRHPRALGDDAGRHPRADPLPRRPHRARRDDVACGGRRPRDGEALRRGVRRALDRHGRAHAPDRERRPARGRPADGRRRHGTRDRRLRPARPTGDRRELRHDPRLGGRPASPARPGERRHARRTPRRRGSSARRGSGSAGPSTCSWRPTGCRSCGR